MGRRTFSATLIAAGLVGVTALAGCADSSESTDAADTTASVRDDPGTTANNSAEAADQTHPDVLEAELTRDGDEYRIAVTISSPYDTPDRYADGWRVMAPGGEILAEHELAHDHANEQPFTRTRGPFAIPDDVDEVVVEGRDQENGYGGDTVTIAVPH